MFLPNLAYTHLKHMKAIFSFIEAIEWYTKEMYVLMWNLNQYKTDVLQFLANIKIRM